jgi:hypothetical protein
MKSTTYDRTEVSPDFSRLQMSSFDRALAQRRMAEAMALAELSLRAIDSVKASLRAAGRAVRRGFTTANANGAVVRTD